MLCVKMALVLGGIIVYILFVDFISSKKLSDNKLITNCKSDTKINDFTDYVPLNLF